ncbi:MAG: hypothetical protein R2845_04000 [Thermomicrobiales bacterium]
MVIANLALGLFSNQGADLADYWSGAMQVAQAVASRQPGRCMIPGILTNLRAIRLDDSALVYDWFNTPAVMDGWGFGVAVVSRTIVAERVAEWIDQERTAGRPVAFIIERAADRRALGHSPGDHARS